MDTVQTAISKEDALRKDVGENVCEDGALKSDATACLAGESIHAKPASAKMMVGSAKAAGLHIMAPLDSENNDDLLEKIEEVVKDDESNGQVPIDSTITESSEQDFIKQLEEAEAEARANRLKAISARNCIPAEDGVSSSDQKGKGESASITLPSDETDRAHLADNVVDSTNTGLVNDKNEHVPIISVEESSEAEVATSELETNLVDATEAKESKNKSNENSEAESKKPDDAKGSSDLATLENGEVAPKNTEECDVVSEVNDSESIKSHKDDAETPSNENEQNTIVDDETSKSTGSKNNTEGDVETECIDLDKDTSSEPEDKVAEIEIKQDTVVNSVPSKSQANPISADTERSETQPMSVDQSPVNVSEKMDVDEEEKMDVDAIEIISDEEMPITSETESSCIEIAKTETLPEPDRLPTAESQKPVSGVDQTVTAKSSENKDLGVSSSTEVTEAKTVEGSRLDSEKPSLVEGTSDASTSEVSSESKKPKLTNENVDDSNVKDQEIPKSVSASEAKTIDEDTIVEINSDSETDEVVELSSKQPVVDSSSASRTKEEDGKCTEKCIEQREAINTKPDPPTSSKANVIESLGDSEAEVTDEGKLHVKLENKLLTNAQKLGGSTASLDNSPVAASSANVFNSTPIQKQFDISSENVSKISDAHEDANRTTEEGAHSSTKTEEETSETGTTSASESTQQSENMAKFLNVIKSQCNGTSSEEGGTLFVTKPAQETFEIIPSGLLANPSQSSQKAISYEINVWHDKHDIRYLSVEKLEAKPTAKVTLDTISTGESSGKLSSNGSVSSLPPFTLPNRSSDSASASSSHSKTPEADSSLAHVNRSQHTVNGIVELCTFMIDQFTKIRNKYEPPSTPTSSKVSPTTTQDDDSTPMKGRGSVKGSTSRGKEGCDTETPTKKTEKRPTKRGLSKTHSEDEEETKPKQTKTSKATQSTSKSQEAKNAADNVLYSVLAKWVDKKYYAGHVTEEKPGNKFVVLFEDGASKVLPRESIVFGEADILPLKDQLIYALLDDDYELGTVKQVEKSDDKVLYTVDIDGKEIKVSASDIYLTDQQAKTIQRTREALNTPSSSNKNVDSPSDKTSPGTSSRSTRKRPATSPLTPEAGFSGGTTKRGRKQKRADE